MIVRIVPVVSKNVQTIGTIIYGNATQTNANDPDDWDDLDRLDRIEFHPDDRDHRVNFEAIIWKRSRTTETIGTIEGYPRNHHSYPTTPSSDAPFQNGGRKHEVEQVTLCGTTFFLFKDYNNKFIRMNIWKAIGEKIGLDATEAEREF